MNIANKYDIIHEVIAILNDISDARGIDRCVKIINSVQKLNFLEQVLNDEDSNNEAAIKELTEKLDSNKNDSVKDDENEDS